MITPTCQRWREQRGVYRLAGEPFSPSRFGVEPAEDKQARAFVERHHYTGAWVASRLPVGLFEVAPFRAPELVGVMVFSVSVQSATAPRWLGVPQKESAEIGRLVLLDRVAANAESWFWGKAVKLARKTLPGLRAVISYADPHRVEIDGQVLQPGHVGTVYQATNARFMGRATARWRWYDPTGKPINERGLSKIRNEERGHAAAAQRLVDQGAPARRFGEDPKAWLERALKEGPFNRIKHPGCLVYGWAWDKDAQKGLAPALPYPKVEALSEVHMTGGEW